MDSKRLSSSFPDENERGMTMATSTELMTQFNAKIAEFERAIANNETEKYEGFNSDLKDIEVEFRAQRQAEIFDDCAKTENPMMALTEIHSFETISHKVIKEENVVTGVEAFYDKKVALNAIKFCKKRDLSLVWANKCEKLAYLLCEDLGTKLNVPDEEMALMRAKYKFSLKGSKGQKMSKGAIASDTQFIKTLQDIVNSLLYVKCVDTDGNECNRIRIIKADVEYVKRFFTKGGNAAELSIKTIDAKGVAEAVFAAMHRILAKKSYSVKFRIAKNPDADDAGKAEVSAPAPKGKEKNEEEPLTMPVPAPAAEVPASDPIEDTLPSMDEMEEV